MSLLAFFILLSIGVSFLCSMLEAVILSVTPSYLASLEETKPNLFKKVSGLKKDIERPLASILTFNTIAHTVGAAGAGAEAQRLFGSEIFTVFSAGLTFAILVFSEIIPKSWGASRWKKLLPFSAKVLGPMITISLPLVWFSEKISSLIKGSPKGVSRDEIAAMADIGFKDGALKKSEQQALKGVIAFEETKATEILTPDEKVMGVPFNCSLEEAYQMILKHTFSRIIVFGEERSDLKGYVLRAKLLKAYIRNPKDKINSLVMPLMVLESNTSLPGLFQRLLKRREHICAIRDSSNKFLGVLTLEDLIEHMLDLEIYDEQDHIIPNTSGIT